jgi:hypothetical protein
MDTTCTRKHQTFIRFAASVFDSPSAACVPGLITETKHNQQVQVQTFFLRTMSSKRNTVQVQITSQRTSEWRHNVYQQVDINVFLL